MESSQAVKASITLPKKLEADLRKVAKKEHRTLSGLLQEAARCYLNVRQWEDLQQELSVKAARQGLKSEADVADMIHIFRSEK